MRVLLRRLGVFVVLQAELPQEPLGVERLLVLGAVAVVRRRRVEFVEEDEEGSGHGDRSGEGIEVRVVLGRRWGQGAERGRRLGSFGYDIGKGLGCGKGLDDGVVETAVAEVDEADTVEGVVYVSALLRPSRLRPAKPGDRVDWAFYLFRARGGRSEDTRACRRCVPPGRRPFPGSWTY